MDEPSIKDLRSRDQTAWRAAFSLLYPIAYKTAKSVRINLNDADAEEVAGQALSELVNCIDKVDSIDGLKALTVTISRRRSISKLRQLTASSRGRGLTDSIDESKDAEGFSEIQVSDNAPSPDQDLAAHQKSLQKFQAVVDSLPDQDAYPSYEPRAANPWDRK
jgi:DNA-directed RNA polymerase specialized sigma24 family protein